MKLVIDISKEDYAETMYRKEHSPREMDWADRVIANGTPLDDIKTEIARYTDTHCNNGFILRESVFEILEQKGVSNADSN